MQIRDIRATSNEARVFRAEVIEKVQIYDCLVRLALSDSTNDVIYCLIEGIFWVEKLNLIILGDKLILGPFKVYLVSKEHVSFYAPKMNDKTISKFYIHYQPNDLNCKLELERLHQNSFPKIIFTNLRECENLCFGSNLSRVNIIAVIIDYVVESRPEKDNLFKIKIVDQSSEAGKYAQINIFLSDFSFNISSLGDIIVLRGVSFRKFKGKIVGTYNKLSIGLGVFH